MISMRRGLGLGIAVRASALIALLLLGGCGGGAEESDTASEIEQRSNEINQTQEADTDAESVASAPMDAPAASSTTASTLALDTSSYPEIATIISLQAGDLMCYAEVMDASEQVFDLGATFEICDRSSQLINQTVRLNYRQENVADCESAEPCGRSRAEILIHEAVLLGDQWVVLSNDEWTVTVGQIETWDGQNNTGNLTYYGCDAEGNCLALTGGAITCRDGMCYMNWRNGNYSYTLASEIGEEASGDTRLLVFEGEKEILNVGGMNEIAGS